MTPRAPMIMATSDRAVTIEVPTVDTDEELWDVARSFVVMQRYSTRYLRRVVAVGFEHAAQLLLGGGAPAGLLGALPA